MDELLRLLGRQESISFRTLITIITTSLKREENILITYSKQDKIQPQIICSLLDYIYTAIMPLSISFTNNQSITRIAQNRRNRNLVNSPQLDPNRKHSMGDADQIRITEQLAENPSPFCTNVAVFENLQTYKDLPGLVRTAKQMKGTFSNQLCDLAQPFTIVGIVPDSVYMSHEVLDVFTYCVHITEPPHSIPSNSTPFFMMYTTFLPEKPPTVYLDRDVYTYISELYLAIDTWPLATGHVKAETRLTMIKAIEDYAFLSGRKFIIPDDVKAIVPCLLTHKYQLPNGTTFAKCYEHVLQAVNNVQVPV